jgi:hypothetical protein
MLPEKYYALFFEDQDVRERASVRRGAPSKRLSPWGFPHISDISVYF